MSAAELAFEYLLNALESTRGTAITTPDNYLALDAQLGGAVQSGSARVDRMQAGWIAVGGVECRVMDFYSVTVSKNSLQAVRSAL